MLRRSFLNPNTKRYTAFILIYCHFSFSIMSIKPYLCPIYRKEVKSTSELSRHFNAYKSHFYLKAPHELLQYKSYNKKDALGGN